MLTFLHPLLLWGLALLPVLFALLRLLPPAPRRVRFPPFFLLAGITSQTPPPAMPPWWLMALRILLLTSLIAGLAGPVWRPKDAPGQNEGTAQAVLLVIDNSWSAAADWPARESLLQSFCDAAEARQQPIAWLATADPSPRATAALSPAIACAAIAGLMPRPWPNDPTSLESALKTAQASAPARTIKWLAAPVTTQAERRMLETLEDDGNLRLLAMDKASPVVWFAQAPDNSAGMTLLVRRADSRERQAFHIDAFDARGNAIVSDIVDFVASQNVASVTLDINPTLRNLITRIGINRQDTAAATLLLDDSARHGSVGLIGAEHEEERTAEPLSSEAFYLTRALEGTATTTTAPLDKLLDTSPDLVIWPGSALLTPTERDTLGQWVRDGGTLLRFAGDSTSSADATDSAANASADGDSLLPERMIDPERTSSLRATGIGLAAFPAASPFSAMAPPADLSVHKQALLSPPMSESDSSIGESDKIWASLEDGTPLVSAESLGKGVLIFVHVPASPAWSTLPFSPFFLDLLNVSLKTAMTAGRGIRQSAGGDRATPLTLAAAIDAFGHLDPADTDERPQPLTAQELRTLPPSPKAPPGLYRAGQETISRNLGPLLDSDTLVATEDLNLPREKISATHEATPFGGFLLAASFLLLLIDWMAMLLMNGYARVSPGRALAAFVLWVAIMGLAAPPASAADSTAIWVGAIESADAKSDQSGLAGLAALADVAMLRTNIENLRAESVNPETAPLPLYALLYWRLPGGAPRLSETAIAHLRDYMASGGMLVIDFADGGQTDSSLARAMLAAKLALPPLVHADATATIAHSYYLLSGFPGSFDQRPLWIERDPPAAHDSTARILVGDADWSTAWAPPGGPSIPPEQREMALRFGINLLMYALTGNYKSDQIHIRAILDKLGQKAGPTDPAQPEDTPIPAGGAP